MAKKVGSGVLGGLGKSLGDREELGTKGVEPPWFSAPAGMADEFFSYARNLRQQIPAVG